MWELRGAANHVTILGSMHFLRRGDPLPEGILAAYEEAEIVIMELDLDDLDPLATQGVVQELGMDPQMRTLEAILGGRDYRAAQNKAKALGMDLALLGGLEPWLAAITITQLRLQQLGFDPDHGVEQQIVRLARRDRKEIRGLESLEEQLAALDKLSPRAQREFLLQTLDEAARIEEQIDDVVTAWKTGATDILEREFLDELKSQPELYRSVVVQRNRNWTRAIAPLTRGTDDYLVVVGTLHLVGEDSLIRMLARDGQKPRQVGLAGG
jgi:uncharacterized protein YbaP (TraB family)